MALKVITFTVKREGRDKGRSYQITEFPASQAERLAIRIMLIMVKSGAPIPDDVVQMGVAGLAILGIKALGGPDMTYELIEPVLDEMMTGIAMLPDPGNPQIVRPLIESDIEEVQTRLDLRKAIFELHVGF